jgi:uncharacterized protein YjbI with pentapeptide repeats
MIGLASLGTTVHADIYQWEYINPADHGQGKQQSTTLAPDGAGVDAARGADLSNRDLTKAYLIGADLTPMTFLPPVCDLCPPPIKYSDLSGTNLTNADLTSANLRGAILSGAVFNGAQVRGASFRAIRAHSGVPVGGISLLQLYTTTSYQDRDLSGIDLGSDVYPEHRLFRPNYAGGEFSNQNIQDAKFDRTDLTGTNFHQAKLRHSDFSLATLAEADLTDADFTGALLTDADFADADVRRASFARVWWGEYSVYVDKSGITLAQLYSTASYKAHDLSGIRLSGHDLTSANFSGQNLSNADFGWELRGITDLLFAGANLSRAVFANANLTNARFVGAVLTQADFTCADARGASLFYPADATTTNLIQRDGHISGLGLDAGGLLVVRDYDGDPARLLCPIPVTIDQYLSMGPGGTLRMVFEADAWDSTISFAPGIPVNCGGTLELTFADDVNLASQVGRTLKIFDWTGVTPSGEFSVTSPYCWDLSNLYSTGEVTLIAIPEPCTLVSIYLAIAVLVTSGRVRLGHHDGKSRRRWTLVQHQTRLPMLTLVAMNLSVASSFAAPTVIDRDHFTNQFAPNSVPGAPVGNNVQISAVLNSLDPVGGTTISVKAIQGDSVVTLNYIGHHHPLFEGVHLYYAFIPFDPSFTGPWQIVASDSSGTAAPVFTNALLDPQFVPYVNNIAVQATSTNARVSWTLPSLDGFDVDASAVRIFDATSGGIVFQSPVLPIQTTTYQPPTGVLQPGIQYVYNIILSDDEVFGHENASWGFSDPFRLTANVPEPSAFLLLTIGLVGVAYCYSVRRRSIPALKFIRATIPLVAFAADARADIYQWEYINPADPSQGKRQSTTLAPDGAGVDAVPGINLSNRNLSRAYLNGAQLNSIWQSSCHPFGGCQYFLVGASFRNTNLSDGDLQNADLSGASFVGANLTGTDLRGAQVQGAQFSRDLSNVNATGISLAQLYSTASYQARALSGIGLNESDLSGGNFVGQNLTNAGFFGATLTAANFSAANLRYAYFYGATVTDADFTGADIRGGSFGKRGEGSGITPAQIYSTASYQARDLSRIDLIGNDLSGIDFTGQKLTAALFANATLAGADFTAADTRLSIAPLADLSAATTTNMIWPNGHIESLDLDGDGLLIVRDDAYSKQNITVDQFLAMGSGGKLRMVFEEDAWASTISFAPGIPVTLGGTLELTFAQDVNPATQVGRTFDVFDWTCVTLTGAFAIASPYAWDTSNLYTTGEVTLTAIPEPSALLLCGFGIAALLLRRRVVPSGRSRLLLIISAMFSFVVLHGAARADIFQWEYIDPADPSQGKRQSTTLAPEGAGLDAVPGANLSGRNLTMAYLIGADLTEANFSAFFPGPATVLTDADLSQGNLRNSSFYGAMLTGAEFGGAEIRGASFGMYTFFETYGTGISLQQLYSTASYQARDLSGVGFDGNNLRNANFSRQNLSNANFNGAALNGADFTGAEIRGANFYTINQGGTVISYAQLTSTASYQARDLRGIDFTRHFFYGGNFAGQNLTNANFEGATLTMADFTAADARGANFYHTDAITVNLIWPDGHVHGLDLIDGDLLLVRDYDGAKNEPTRLVPITVDQQAAMGPGGTLRMMFEADAWDSTISFAPDIPVTLGGTLELTFAADVNAATQVGRTFDLFDWTGVTPTGAFTISSPYTWDLSNLYATGKVTFTAVPEPPTVFLPVAIAFCGWRLRRRFRAHSSLDKIGSPLSWSETPPARSTF